MKVSGALVALMLACLASAAGARPAQSPIFGVWANPAGTVKVEMKPCGGNVCGVVVWATPEAQRVAADAGTDPLVGVQLLSDYRAVGPDAWEGTMFVPDLRGQYASQMQLVGPNTVEISGCMMGKLLCKSQTWTRAAGPRPPAPARRRAGA